ncbi:hypothetical protein [Rhodopirellula sp. MGV]|uniref:hypothetical protein n=1 Tax=Rhodopirellula sp. MGV TaxID=2023130 RepID=UPI000B973C4D|nr:hypothetical protein [Rhodopirellula sp. MGV]OYP35827.1 hypothetical protein CGZ80_10545 [Rhodopirellula sp. MGV]PNY36360.1 hypothetical protein C2E31_13065 [Rhodopirellula baltica]
MAINIESVFSSGGKPMLEMLTHCVFSINSDVLFSFLVREFQTRPTAQAAVVLHDVFCVTQSPMCLSDNTLIVPKDWRLANEVDRFRKQIERANDEANLESEPLADEADGDVGSEQTVEPVTIEIPPRYLFDAVANFVKRLPAGGHAKLQGYYDSSKSPSENLPNGELSAAQRIFVDNVWVPRVRPALIAAGFWRMSTVG